MRADLLGSFVQSVEITEKENVTLELLPKSHSLDSYPNGFALKSEMGAERPLNSNPTMAFPVLRGTAPLQNVPKTRKAAAAPST